MVSRVSTTGNYSAILTNLLAGEARQAEAGARVSSQKNGTDLKAYSTKAETLTASRTVHRRLETYQAQNDIISAKLTVQDQGLSQVADSATAIRQAIADALATDRGDSLLPELGAQLHNAVAGLNSQYDGKYVFAGGQIDTQPVTVNALTDLTAGPPIDSFFKNDSLKVQAKVSDSTTLTTGVLASDVGTDLLTGLKTIQAFNDGGSGPFSGQLTDAQRTFLQNQLAGWDAIRENATQVTAQNGQIQQRVESVKTGLAAQHDTLTALIGGITDADLAKAETDLSTAQLSLQATAQVLTVLQSSSLLNFLRN